MYYGMKTTMTVIVDGEEQEREIDHVRQRRVFRGILGMTIGARPPEEVPVMSDDEELIRTIDSQHPMIVKRMDLI